MSAVTYTAPTGEDRSPVMNEVLEYWKRRMRVSGAEVGFSEGCSPAFAPVEGEVLPEGMEGVPFEERYSDYEEHRILMDATPGEMLELVAMLIARGIKVQGGQ